MDIERTTRSSTQYSTVCVHKMAQIIKRVWPTLQEDVNIIHGLPVSKKNSPYSEGWLTCAPRRKPPGCPNASILAPSASSPLALLDTGLGTAFLRTRLNSEGQLTCPPGPPEDELPGNRTCGRVHSDRVPLRSWTRPLCEPQLGRFCSFVELHNFQQTAASTSHFRVGCFRTGSLYVKCLSLCRPKWGAKDDMDVEMQTLGSDGMRDVSPERVSSCPGSVTCRMIMSLNTDKICDDTQDNWNQKSS